jgi:hypothetical protein
MWPLSAVQLSPVARPCYRRSCPNGPRFIRREITRMMSAIGVRREKVALSSGCKPHPATAPAGGNRSSHGGNKVAEAFD